MPNDYSYIYEGPVMQFGRVVRNRWTGRTRANTSGRALTNLSFRYKAINQLVRTAQIELDPRYLRLESE